MLKKLLLTVFTLNFMFLSIHSMEPYIRNNPILHDISTSTGYNDSSSNDDSSSSSLDIDSDLLGDVSLDTLESDDYSSSIYSDIDNIVIDDYHRNILHAIQDGDLSWYLSLIREAEGLDILKHIVIKTNSSDDAGFLNYACGMCIDGSPNIKIIKSLFYIGVDPEHTNINCTTPLNILVSLFYDNESTFLRSQLIDILEFMLEAGANPNGLDTNVEFPLLKASFFGKYGMVKKLLSYGADPNLQDNYGNTPLHNAVVFPYLSWVKTVKALIENGADPTIRNNKEDTPLYLILKQLDDFIFIMFLIGNINMDDTCFIKDISSYLGLVEMICLILDTGICLDQLIDLRYLEKRLFSIYGREINFEHFSFFINAFKNYENIFINLSNRYRFLPEGVNIKEFGIENRREFLGQFYNICI